MGYHRNPQRPALDRAAIRAEVIPLLADELAFVERTLDPFEIERCSDPVGHFPIRTSAAIICAHCEKVFWQ